MKKLLILISAALLSLGQMKAEINLDEFRRPDVLPEFSDFANQILSGHKPSADLWAVPTPSTMHRAPGDEITITSDDGFNNAVHYTNNNSWYITLKKDNYIVHYCIYTDKLGGTYTLADCDPVNTNVNDGSGVDKFTDITIVFTGDYEDKNIGYDCITDGTTESGTIYHINVHKEGLYSNPDVYINANDGFDLCEYTDSRNYWFIRFNEAPYYVHLGLNGEHLGGHYTIDDCIRDYSKVTRDGVHDDFSELDLTFSGDFEDPNVGYDLSGTAKGVSGTTYHINVHRDAQIVPSQTYTFESSLTKILMNDYASDGTLYQLKDNDSELTLSFVMNTVLGQYSAPLGGMKNVVITTADGQTVTGDHGTANVTCSNMELDITADIVGKDGTEYKTHASYALNVENEEEINCKNLNVTRSLMGFYFFGDDEDWKVTASVVDLDNELAAHPLGANEIEVALSSSTKEVHSQLVESAELTTEADGSIGLKAVFYGNDNVKYSIHMCYELQGTNTITIENLEYVNMLKNGAQQIYGFNADQTMVVSLAMLTYQAEGTFSFADGSLESSYCYLAMMNPDNTEKIDKLVYFVDGTCTVTKDENNVLTAHCDFVGDDAWLYDMTLTAIYTEPEKDHPSYDCDDEDVDVVFAAEDLVMIEDYINRDAYVYVKLANEERSDLFSMIMYIYQADPDHVIPADTYPINTSYANHSVQPGRNYDGYIYPTFYARINENEEVKVPLWYLDEGTVTVSYNSQDELMMEVNAVNSYNRTIHILYNPSTVGIASLNETSTIKAQKLMQKGMFVVKTAGQVYNMQGQLVR